MVVRAVFAVHVLWVRIYCLVTPNTCRRRGAIYRYVLVKKKWNLAEIYKLQLSMLFVSHSMCECGLSATGFPAEHSHILTMMKTTPIARRSTGAPSSGPATCGVTTTTSRTPGPPSPASSTTSATTRRSWSLWQAPATGTTRIWWVWCSLLSYLLSLRPGYGPDMVSLLLSFSFFSLRRPPGGTGASGRPRSLERPGYGRFALIDRGILFAVLT